MIHEALHTSWGIGWSESHDSRGVESICHFECQYVLHLFILVTQVPVSVGEIDFSELGFSSGAFNDGVYAGEWEDVLDCNCIDLSVIEYGVETPVLLFDIEYWGSIRGLRFSD